MRASVVLVGLLAVTALAEPPGPTRWQQATNPPPISRVWGIARTLYGASSAGVFRSTDNGASWTLVSAGAAAGIWGAARDDLWIVRAKTIHQSATGLHWTTQQLPMLSYAAQLEGMWGIDRERYLFGADRSGAILHSRDGGASWRVEALPIEVARIAGVWGSAANDVYAVGARGVILHSAGDGQWSVVRAPTSGSLEGIWGASATSIYAVGANGSILHSADRGKTWTPRTSGVTYTLSSIVGLGSELYASSIVGAPLRSNDGRTWKPITAMVRRGHVWPEGERLVVASASDVYFLGEVDAPRVIPSPVPVPPGPITKWLISRPSYREALALDLAGERQFGSRLPHARDLIKIAAHRFGSSWTYEARLDFVGPPVVRFGTISNCLGAGKPDPTARAAGVDIDIKVTCTLSCSEVTIAAAARISRDGVGQAFPSLKAKAVIASCAARKAAVDDLLKVAIEETTRKYQEDLVVPRPVVDPDTRLDALARYVLFGGADPRVKTEIAAVLGQPVDWPGFFWNPPPKKP